MSWWVIRNQRSKIHRFEMVSTVGVEFDSRFQSFTARMQYGSWGGGWRSGEVRGKDGEGGGE